MSSPQRSGESLPATSDNGHARGLLEAAVQHDEHHDAVIIRVAGEIDSYTASTLGETITGALASFPGRRLLVIDLERVEFIGSQGLAQLIAAADRLGQTDTTMLLAAANAAVRMLLAVTGTGSLFDLRPTVADALATPPSPGSG